MNRTLVTKSPYSSLADIYDEVMHNVDYESWADYIDEIILQHKPDATDLLELACGTGTIALSLEELDCYKITATDVSADMIRVAKQKAEQGCSEIDFHTMDFLNIKTDKCFDVVFMVFDSINYLHCYDDIIKLHGEVKKVLKPGGIFVYDFTTPRNSRKAIRYLNNDTKTIDSKIRYYRASSFDGKNRIHTNLFRIQHLNHLNGSVESTHEEIHQQKIYTIEEMETIIKQTDFTILQAYDGFELKPAHKKSLRITMVLQ
jgi:ubiquinone/menaquinone biosynthesis C-methylase UbiE